MEVLWLLIPMSALLVLGVLAVFGWALWRGQFDDLDQEGERILHNEPKAPAPFDIDQAAWQARPEESAPSPETQDSKSPEGVHP